MTATFSQSAYACDVPVQPKLSESEIESRAKSEAFSDFANADLVFEGRLIQMKPGAVTDFQDHADVTFKIDKCLKGKCGKEVKFQILPSSDCSELPVFVPKDIKAGSRFWVTLNYSNEMKQYVWDGAITTSVLAKQ